MKIFIVLLLITLTIFSNYAQTSFSSLEEIKSVLQKKQNEYKEKESSYKTANGKGSVSKEDSDEHIELLDELNNLKREIEALSIKIKPVEDLQSRIKLIEEEIVKKKADAEKCGEGECTEENRLKQEGLELEIARLEDDKRQLGKTLDNEKKIVLDEINSNQVVSINEKDKTAELKDVEKNIKQQSWKQCLESGIEELDFDTDLPSQEIKLGKICNRNNPQKPNDRLCSQYVKCSDGTLRFTVCSCNIMEDVNSNNQEIAKKCVLNNIGVVETSETENIGSGFRLKEYKLKVKKL